MINYLTLRRYSRRLLKREVNRVCNISRQEALKPRLQNNQSARTPFVITFNPALPNTSTTVWKNLNILQSSARCKLTFSPPPVIAYERTPNLRNLLVRTQLRDNTDPQQKAPPGIYKCNNPCCLACPLSKEGQAKYTFSATKEERCINDNLNCKSKNLNCTLHKDARRSSEIQSKNYKIGVKNVMSYSQAINESINQSINQPSI